MNSDNLPERIIVEDKTKFKNTHSKGDRKAFLDFLIDIFSDIAPQKTKDNKDLLRIFLEYISSYKSFEWDDLFSKWKSGDLSISDFRNIISSKLSAIAKSNEDAAMIVYQFSKERVGELNVIETLQKLTKYESFYKRKIALVLSENKTNDLFDYLYRAYENAVKIYRQHVFQRRVTKAPPPINPVNGTWYVPSEAKPAKSDQQQEKNAEKGVESVFKHSDDYRSVLCRGKNFTLTPKQSQVIHILHEAYKNKTPDVSQAMILEEIGSPSNRLKDIFKTHRDAWDVLIKQGERKGTYHLNI